MSNYPTLFNGKRNIGGTAAAIMVMKMDGGYYPHLEKLYEEAYDEGYNKGHQDAVRKFVKNTIKKNRLKLVD